jgi:hypothetical protein
MACWHAIPRALACLYHPQLQDKEDMVRLILKKCPVVKPRFSTILDIKIEEVDGLG